MFFLCEEEKKERFGGKTVVAHVFVCASFVCVFGDEKNKSVHSCSCPYFTCFSFGVVVRFCVYV